MPYILFIDNANGNRNMNTSQIIIVDLYNINGDTISVRTDRNGAAYLLNTARKIGCQIGKLIDGYSVYDVSDDAINTQGMDVRYIEC